MITNCFINNTISFNGNNGRFIIKSAFEFSISLLINFRISSRRFLVDGNDAAFSFIICC